MNVERQVDAGQLANTPSWFQADQGLVIVILNVDRTLNLKAAHKKKGKDLRTGRKPQASEDWALERWIS